MGNKGSTVVLIPLIVFLIIGGFLYFKFPVVQLVKEKFTQKPIVQTTLTKQATTPLPTPTITIHTDLPKIVERNSSSISSSWKEYSDSRGYKFSYPSNWFIANYEDKAQQIQNWDSKLVKRAEPLSGNQSKWDVSFSSENFNSIDELLNLVSEGIRVDKIEKSKTANNQTIYFIEGTGSFFGNEDVRVPVIYAVIIEGNKFFSWYGIVYGGDKNVEILKQTVESIR